MTDEAQNTRPTAAEGDVERVARGIMRANRGDDWNGYGVPSPYEMAIARAAIAALQAKEAAGPTVVVIGVGEIVSNWGTYEGIPAVFLQPTRNGAGELGAELPPEDDYPKDSVPPGTVILQFQGPATILLDDIAKALSAPKEAAIRPSELAGELERRLKKACGQGWHPFALEAAEIATEAITALARTDDTATTLLREAVRSEIINTPETADFMAAVPIEAVHQRERWGSSHDAGKTPFDWFWLVGYLAQKAASSAVAGDPEKAKHHTISTAAALANWHAALSGADNSMMPGAPLPIQAQADAHLNGGAS